MPQHPNDEPGSVLLERIRAKRAARDNVSRQPPKKRDSRRAVAAQKGNREGTIRQERSPTFAKHQANVGQTMLLVDALERERTALRPG